MSVLQKYFAIEIIRWVSFVLIAFLALFAFFDLINELPAVGRGGYRLQQAFAYVILGMPGYTYELMPIAALIGTIYVLAQFASHSEFTIMRISGLSTVQAGAMLAKIGVLFALITFLFGEVVAPKASQFAETMKLSALGAPVSQEFRTGLWAKDLIKANGATGVVIGSRFLNVREIRPGGQLRRVTLYELDKESRLTTLVSAAVGDYKGSGIWRLTDVSETHFPDASADIATLAVRAATSSRKMESKEFVSEVTPEILSVLFADPDRMSAYNLAAYAKHLEHNAQRTERYEIAFWKKLIYPLAVFVMMALALPFAYLHVRSGGVSLKIFTGIMIGVSFQLLNSLFSHLGLLNTWPPFATAIMPSALFLLAAIGALWWVERR